MKTSIRSPFVYATLLICATALGQNGVHDLTFGTNGYTILDPTSDYDWPKDMAMDLMNRPIIAGHNSGPVNTVCWVCRLQPDGAADASFGPNGCRIVNLCTSSDGLAAISVLSDGRIMGIGNESWGQFSITLDQTVIFRLNVDGTLDTTWAQTGMKFITFNNWDLWSVDMAIDPAGGVVALGRYAPGGLERTVLWRHHPSGDLDTTFNNGTSKVVIEPLGASSWVEYRSLGLLSDGRIVIAGREEIYNSGITTRWNAVRCYMPDGSVDSSFATNGLLLDTIAGSALLNDHGMLVQPDDAIMMYGNWSDGTNYRVAACRFMPDGTPDPSFGTNGRSVMLTANYGPSIGRGALLPDGRLALPNIYLNNCGTLVVNNDGSHDLTFGTNGLATGSQSHRARVLAAQGDSAIVVATMPQGTETIGVLRYSAYQLPLDIGSHQGTDPLTLWPIPSDGQDVRLIAKDDVLRSSQVTVLDIQGRRQPITTRYDGGRIVLLGSSHLPKGSYIVRVSSSKGSWASRMIID